MSLAQLPTELYFAIIQQFEPDDTKSSLLALSRAIPHSPVPVHALFNDILLKTPRQVVGLYRRLRKHPEDVLHVVTFALESLVVDADVLVNLVAMLPNIRELTLFIGPNFAPEHLEDLFKNPRPPLKYLSLRFRPYVQRATYLQFMKGTYFDSVLLCLSRWPRTELPVMSIIQDPIPKAVAPSQNFAQPLVFFHLEPLSTFASSPTAGTVSYFRFRVPGRAVARYISQNPHSFSNTELLDMATCDVGPSQILDILCRLGSLRYLILDGCPMVSQRVDALDAAGAEDYSNWAALGQTLATMGLKRSREREQQLQHWLESVAIAEEMQDVQLGADPSPLPTTTKKRSGRHKVAMSPFKMRTSSLNKSGETSSSQPLASSSSLQRPGRKVERIRILPPVPTLQSVALTAPMITGDGHDLEERCDAARSAFELGWAEGIAMVAKKRALIKTSWTNGIRTMNMAKLGSKSDDEMVEENGFAGLEDIHALEEFNIQDERCPTLCLAGPGREGRHLDRCPHTIGWEAFKDEL